MKYEELIKKAIIETSKNNPDWDMGKQMETAIFRYIEEYEKKDGYPVKRFCNHLSSRMYGSDEPLRKKVLDYSIDNDYDVALGFLDIIYNYSKEKRKNSDFSVQQSKQLTKFIRKYLSIVSIVSSSESDYYDAMRSDSPLNYIKNKIYDNPKILSCIISNSISDIIKNDSFFSNVVNNFISDIKIEDLDKKDSIELISVSKTAEEILTNVEESRIINSFSGKMLDGRITVASDRGYLSKPDRPQQDAVFSMSKSEDNFLSIIADGAGGSQMGEYASMSIVKKLATWYKNISIDSLENLDRGIIEQLINKQLVEANNEIYEKYKGKSYSTVSLVLCVGGKTLLANVGDSTVYSYDGEDKELKLETRLDSRSRGLGYEEARHNLDNNIVTKVIGNRYLDEYERFVKYKWIHNKGQKLIMSSDGVTDLIKESRFKSYFKKDVDASSIVQRSVYKPDKFKVKNLDGKKINGKSEDNSSAIVIQLPDSYKEELNSFRRM